MPSFHRSDMPPSLPSSVGQVFPDPARPAWGASAVPLSATWTRWSQVSPMAAPKWQLKKRSINHQIWRYHSFSQTQLWRGPPSRRSTNTLSTLYLHLPWRINHKLEAFTGPIFTTFSWCSPGFANLGDVLLVGLARAPPTARLKTWSHWENMKSMWTNCVYFPPLRCCFLLLLLLSPILCPAFSHRSFCHQVGILKKNTYDVWSLSSKYQKWKWQPPGFLSYTIRLVPLGRQKGAPDLRLPLSVEPFKFAVENPPFIDDFPMKTVICIGDFPAMFR